MNFIGLIFIIMGVFSFIGGIFNWDWFMNTWKSRLLVKTFTRKGARIFYCILGMALFVGGVLTIF